MRMKLKLKKKKISKIYSLTQYRFHSINAQEQKLISY